MKKILISLLSVVAVITNITAQNDTYLKLWYTQPAKQWVEALPVGNGRLGAMVYGDPSKELIQLNESTVWAGSPYRNDNPEARQALSEVRRLIFEGKYKEAHDIVNEKFISKISHGMPYQTMGNLRLFFPGHENCSDYYRELDLKEAVVSSRYSIDGIKYETRVFSSFPDQILVISISADKPGSVSFQATLDRPSDVDITTNGNDELVMSGRTNNFEEVKGNLLEFMTKVKVLTTGGSVSATDTALNISEADAATLYVSMATNFVNYNNLSAKAGERVNNYLQNALKKNYDQLFKDHVVDYQKYFNRVSLDLGITDAVNNPTDIRLEQFAKSNDPQLVSLYFQFGRYLLISSSRPGGQPANLQGIWNDQLTPSWDSKYTININTEMNYWPSEITNLTEMNEPLVSDGPRSVADRKANGIGYVWCTGLGSTSQH
jgi:alpha-L-fucosidase 2